MKIHSTNSSSIINQFSNKNGKGSAKNTSAEQKQLDQEIQNLQQKKVDLNKEIDNIKGDFAPPKPKDELIRPIKDQIQTIDAQIQQKQMEKMKLQSDKSDEDKQSNLATDNLKDKTTPTPSNEENNSDLKLLKNLTTQVGFRNKAKINDPLKNQATLMIKEIDSNDVSNTSDSIKSITEKIRHKQTKNGVETYKAIENSCSSISTTNTLA